LTLYLFDRTFRLLVMEAIERLEISFRTKFAYELAMKSLHCGPRNGQGFWI